MLSCYPGGLAAKVTFYFFLQENSRYRHHRHQKILNKWVKQEKCVMRDVIDNSETLWFHQSIMLWHIFWRLRIHWLCVTVVTCFCLKSFLIDITDWVLDLSDLLYTHSFLFTPPAQNTLKGEVQWAKTLIVLLWTKETTLLINAILLLK